MGSPAFILLLIYSILIMVIRAPQGLSAGVHSEGGESGGGVHPGEDSGECASLWRPGCGQPDGCPALLTGQRCSREREELRAVLWSLQ